MSLIYKMCWTCGHNDVYSISTQSIFQDAIQQSILEYRYLVGKNMNNYNLATTFRHKRIRYYDGRYQQRESSDWKLYDIVVDLRGDFIYGVYRS